jgi:SAM-dependent methyltransferase
MNWHERYLQQAGWTWPLRQYLFRRAGLEQAHRVLEVGCGTGVLLAELSAPVAVHGLDHETNSLGQAQCHAPHARLTRAKAQALPYANGCFDLVFCHYFLLWVGNPVAVLQEMRRVTQQQGYVLAMAEPDYEGRLDEPPELAALGQLQTTALQAQGVDTAIGRKLPVLFQLAGLHVLESGQLQPDARPDMDPADWSLEWEVLESDLQGRIPADELQRFKQADLQAWRAGRRILHVPTYFTLGVV